MSSLYCYYLVNKTSSFSKATEKVAIINRHYESDDGFVFLHLYMIMLLNKKDFRTLRRIYILEGTYVFMERDESNDKETTRICNE